MRSKEAPGGARRSQEGAVGGGGGKGWGPCAVFRLLYQGFRALVATQKVCSPLRVECLLKGS